MSPLLAQSGHSDTLDQCPLSGVKRTLWALGILQKFREAENRNLKLTGQFITEKAICSKKS
jgi:hypothetical protein